MSCLVHRVLLCEYGTRFTLLDQKVEAEPVSLSCTSDKMLMDGDEMSTEIFKSKLLNEGLGSCSVSTISSDKAEETVNHVFLQSMGQTDVIRPILLSCSENMIEKIVMARDEISVEAPEKKLEKEDLNVFSESRESTLNDENSGETVNEIMHNVESAGEITEDGGECIQGSSQVVDEIANIKVERSLSHYKGKKLLVLDVNGLLVDISSYIPYDYYPDEIILRKAIFKRPHCDDFLKFCFEKFNVGLWSSRTKTNMEPIIDYLLGSAKQNLLFHWDQSHCTHSGFHTVEKRHKPLYVKKLKRLWDKCDPDLPWDRGVYNESNTLMLDDSPYKALCNPPYTAIFPHTYRFRDTTDNSLGFLRWAIGEENGPEGDILIYLKGLAMAENVQEYIKQNPFGQRPISEKNLSWGYYQKVIEACSSPPHQRANKSLT